MRARVAGISMNDGKGVVYHDLPPSPAENTSQFTHRSRLEYTTKQLFDPGSASGDLTIS